MKRRGQDLHPETCTLKFSVEGQPKWAQAGALIRWGQEACMFKARVLAYTHMVKTALGRKPGLVGLSSLS